MPDIQDYKNWCDKARKILSVVDREGPNTMENRNDEVADLLVKMKDSPACTAGSEFEAKFIRLKEEYSTLATVARVTQMDKKLSSDKKKKEITAVSIGLKKLGEEARLALGSVDPTATKEVRGAILEAVRNQPVYENKCVRIEEAIYELEQLPGTATHVKKLKGLLAAGKKAEPNYIEAYEALEGLSGTLEAGRDAAAKFGKKAGGDDFQLKLTAARKAIADYRKVASIGDAEGIALAEKAVEGTINTVDETDQVKLGKAKIAATKVLDDTINDLTLKTNALTVAENALKVIQPRVTTMINQLVLWAPAAITTTHLANFNIATGLAGSQQFALANTAFETLEAAVTPVHAAQKLLFEKWTALNGELTKTHEPYLVGARKLGSAALDAVGGPLEQAIQMEARSKRVPAREFKEAVALAEGVIADMPAFVKLVEAVKAGTPAVPEFGDEGKNLRARSKIREGELKAASDTLAAKLGELETLGGDRSTFDTAIAEQKKASEEREWPFVDSKDALPEKLRLEAPLISASTKAIELINGLVTQADGIIKDPAKLKDSKADKANGDLGKEFEAKRVTAAKALNYLEGYGLPDDHAVMKANRPMTVLRSNYDELLTLAKQKTYFPIRMENMTKDFVEKRQFIDLELQKHTTAAATEAAEILKSIAAMEKENKDYKTYFASLRDKVTDCLGMTGSTIFTVVEAGELKLAGVKSEMAAIRSSIDSADPAAENFKRVATETKALEAKIKNKDLIAYQPTAQASFKARFEKALPAALKQLSPADALKHLKEFDTEVAEAMKLVEQAKLDRVTLDNDVKAAKVELAAIKTSAPALYATLKKQIEGSGAVGKGDEKRGMLAVNTARIMIQSAVSSPARAKKLDDKVKRDEFENEKQVAIYKAAKDLFEKNAKREADAKKSEFTTLGVFTSGDCNVEIHDQMGLVADEAAKFASAGNYTAANEKLRQATGLANYFVANPFNPASTARKELLRINGEWKAAVSGYLKGLAELKTKFTSEAQTDSVDAEVVKKASAALDELPGLFNASAFEATATLLAKEMKDIKETRARRQSKEAALAEVRRLQRLLSDHTVLKEVVANPFTGLTGKPLGAALASFDAALLAAN